VLIGPTCGAKRQSGIQAPAVNWLAAVVGRGRPDAIETPKDFISQLRARIVSEAGRYRVWDLNSANGTFVTGRRTQEHILGAERRVGIGGEVRFFLGTNEDRR
jgi:hypothetical protein